MNDRLRIACYPEEPACPACHARLDAGDGEEAIRVEACPGCGGFAAVAVQGGAADVFAITAEERQTLLDLQEEHGRVLRWQLYEVLDYIDEQGHGTVQP